MTLTGECFCGSIQYQINGRAYDARSCHCSRCRKAFSAQASSYALVNSSEFQWLRGEALLTVFESQPGFGWQFCSRCGSTLCGTHNGEVHGITLGCLNNDPELEIGYHLYIGSKASWERLPSGVTLYEAAPPEQQA
ncbi:GFA family protein [Halioxenophilus sp. WMMB6]|uniref:GFA family protein n=1 Tax=Halioxenophilus sp. WMMB6 TaxID=3073815 RepID=UPI00295F46B9|nr:GFA family protein [Halioxenophilus sp. WMMB6]